MELLEPIYPLAFPAPSFNLKDMAPGLGSETRLDRSKGDTRSDTVLLDSSATLITNEGRLGGGQGIDGSGARASQNQWLWNTPLSPVNGQIMKRQRAATCLQTTCWVTWRARRRSCTCWTRNTHTVSRGWGSRGGRWGQRLRPCLPCPCLAAEEPEYVLPQEAFPLRHEIVDTPPGPEHLQDKADSPHVSGSEADAASLAPVDSSFSLISISHALYDTRLPPDFFSALVCDMLRFYAEQGDVQMAVSVLIVLGERVRKDIDEQTQVGDWDEVRGPPCHPRTHALRASPTVCPPPGLCLPPLLAPPGALVHVLHRLAAALLPLERVQPGGQAQHQPCHQLPQPGVHHSARQLQPLQAAHEQPRLGLRPVPPLRQHVRRLPPRGQGSVRVVPGLQSRRPPAAHHEVAGGQLPLPRGLRPPVRVLLTRRRWARAGGAGRGQQIKEAGAAV